MSKHALTVPALVFIATPLIGQSAPAPYSPPAPAELNTALIKPYHHAFHMIASQNGQEADIGTLDDRLIVINANGRPVFIRIQNVDTPTGNMLDSAIADSSSLSPRHHSSVAEHRQLLLEFAPKRVTGQYFEPGDPPIPIDQGLADGVFDSNMLDVLIGAMPLAQGYAGRLLIYIYEAGGPVPMDVAVTGSETLNGSATWVANVTISGRTVRYYVDKADHQVAQVVSPGVRLVRIAPAR
jgi:hypothetical protein